MKIERFSFMVYKVSRLIGKVFVISAPLLRLHFALFPLLSAAFDLLLFALAGCTNKIETSYQTPSLLSVKHSRNKISKFKGNTHDERKQRNLNKSLILLNKVSRNRLEMWRTLNVVDRMPNRIFNDSVRLKKLTDLDVKGTKRTFI